MKDVDVGEASTCTLPRGEMYTTDACCYLAIVDLMCNDDLQIVSDIDDTLFCSGGHFLLAATGACPPSACTLGPLRSSESWTLRMLASCGEL